MSLTDDAELRAMFRAEIAERSRRLAAGARACAAGEIDPGLASDLYREGHTIKGTARLMGYTAIADAGKLLEEAWRGIGDGEVTVNRSLTEALEGLAAGLEDAVEADPDIGPPALAEAVRSLRVALNHGGFMGDAPPVPAETMPVEQTDLGGLLGSIDSWAFGEKVRVSAAGLFRLIDEVCSLRVEAGALAALIDELTSSLGDGEAVAAGLAHLSAAMARADKALEDLQSRALDLAASPLSDITGTHRQLVRYLGRKAGKEIRFELIGDHHAVDRLVLDGLSNPLRQLLVNAVEHGVELPAERVAAGKPPTATVSLHASVDQGRLRLVVEDDGRGVDWDAVRAEAIRRHLLPAGRPGRGDRSLLHALLFGPGFSTAPLSETAGDGNGLAEVAAATESLRGSVVLESEPGRGTRVTITVPTSRSLQSVVLVRAAGQIWGLPEITVLDTLSVPARADRGRRGQASWRGALLPAVSFAEAVGLSAVEPADQLVVASTAAGPVGFLVTEVIGHRQVAARELGPLLNGAPHVTGAALLGGGDVVVLVDPGRMAERFRVTHEPAGPRPRVLVVDDSRGVRQVVGGALGLAGFEVDLAGSPTEALSALAAQRYDAILLDYVLPTMDGATLVRRIRALGITAPVVMMSGLATEADRERALAAGADDYFDKNDLRRGALAEALHRLVAVHTGGGARGRITTG
jgi:chemotaxis protein histidine kinase CheA